ncbi:hypothetical protein [Chitinophaga sp. RAB17]|uniref:hypothetical protein n=1 Tax=Chitinophaga sp. RAB17 TaxID=3233049 RepID=UPI003F93EFCD
MLLISCTERRTVNYYYNHRLEIDTVSKISRGFLEDYQFDYFSITQWSPEIKVLVGQKGHTIDGVTGYFDPHTFERVFRYAADTCNACTSEERVKDSSLLADNRIKQLMHRYMKMKLVAFRVDSSGAFFALGDAQKLHGFSMMTGILLPFRAYVDSSAGLIRQIDNEHAYLYDKLVQ